MGREGQGTAKRRGGCPWEGPRGSTAIATAASTTSKPMGRGPGRDNKTRIWSDDGAIAALEFSQPSLGRRGTGTWQPGSGGPSQAAGDRSGEAATGLLGHQGSRTELEGRPGAASTGGVTTALPSGAATGRPTLPGRGQEGGPTLGALPTGGEIRPAGGAPLWALLGLWGDTRRSGPIKIGNPRAGAEDPTFALPPRRALPHHRCPRKDDPQERREASFTGRKERRATTACPPPPAQRRPAAGEGEESAYTWARGKRSQDLSTRTQGR